MPTTLQGTVHGRVAGGCRLLDLASQPNAKSKHSGALLGMLDGNTFFQVLLLQFINVICIDLTFDAMAKDFDSARRRFALTCIALDAKGGCGR